MQYRFAVNFGTLSRIIIVANPFFFNEINVPFHECPFHVINGNYITIFSFSPIRPIRVTNVTFIHMVLLEYLHILLNQSVIFDMHCYSFQKKCSNSIMYSSIVNFVF